MFIIKYLVLVLGNIAVHALELELQQNNATQILVYHKCLLQICKIHHVVLLKQILG